MPVTTLIPIHLDALYVESDGSIETAPALADFTLLDEITVKNPTNAYLGENLTNGPLSTTQGLSKLDAGFHLHWALPDALTKTMGLPLVGQQSFRNIFGLDTGTSIWTALQSASWIKLIKNHPNTAKVLKERKDRNNPPSGISAEQLGAVNSLLDHHLYPATPNRWLVTRFKQDGTSVDKQWVVESDYVWPDKGQDNHGKNLKDQYTSYPVLSSTDISGILDYCFIGQWYELGQAKANGGSYLPDPLTAVGFGEPTFAAFYPNCRTVFGFHDPDKQTKRTYEVLGWFSDPTQDYFSIFCDDFLGNNTPPDSPHPYTALLGALKTEFDWFLPISVKKSDFSDPTCWDLLQAHNWLEDSNGDTAILGTPILESGNTLGVADPQKEKTIRDTVEGLIKQQLPTQTLYYARCNAGEGVYTQPTAAGDVTLAMGNTGTEAMSAYLAQKMAPGCKGLVEDYLEAQQLTANLQHQHLDLGPKFEEARHEKGFTAVPGGTIWTIRTQSSSNKRASQMKAGEEITLPDILADLLNELNTIQQQCDQTHFQIESLQQQIFIDWSTYLKIEVDLLSAQDAPSGGPGNQNGPGPGGGPPNQDGPPGDGPPDGGPSNQNGSGPGGAPPNNQSGQKTDTHLKEMLKDLQKMIEWEIDVVLKSLLDDLNQNLSQQFPQVQQQLAEGLAIFEQASQYLQDSDIKDWDAFNTAVQHLSLKAIQGINFSTISEKELLEVINEKVMDDADLYNKLNFPSGKETQEAKDLESKKGTKDWISGVYLRFNRLLLEALLPIAHQPRYIVQAIAAPRYWQPTEPSLLISGVQPSPRHGQDGRLRDDHLLSCSAMNLSGLPTTVESYQQLEAKLESIKNAEPDNFALHPGTNDWHPLLLDFDVNFTQAKNNYAQKDPNTYQYLDAYLESHYALNLDAVDFAKEQGGLDEIPIPFSSRCILTPSGSLLQKGAVMRNLVPDILEAVQKTLNPKVPDAAITRQQFVNWVNAGTPNDAALKALVDKPIYSNTSDTQQITDWITTRLANTADGNLPGIVSWYWQALKGWNKQVTIPDSEGSALSSFITAAMANIQVKKSFYDEKQIGVEGQSDFELQNNTSYGFIAWLQARVGSSTLAAFFKDQKITEPTGAALDAFLSDNFNAVINWFQVNNRTMLHKVIDYFAYKNLFTIQGLSQALGGFNKALVNLSQTYQLNVADPLANDQAGKDFVTKVRAAVQQQNSYSALFAGDYAPIRAGMMTFSRVNLINSFGQYWPAITKNLVDSSKWVSTEEMVWEAGTKDVALAPRLAQPARLNFRWLSAHSSLLYDDTFGQDIVEMNSHPATSPICGWVLANNLDNSLMVYHQNGQALGYIDQTGHWRVFPGHAGPVLTEDIDNPHLSNMVQRLCRIAQSSADNQASFIAAFIDVLDTAADSIAPDNSAQHNALSLLMGRPFALVRATVSLEQKGLSTPFKRSDPTDPLFQNELTRFTKLNSPGPDDFKWTTYKYEEVKIPLRLGEFRQLNDGMAGYWIDSAPGGALPDGITPDTFFAPQSFDPGKVVTEIMTHNEDGSSFQFNLTLAQQESIQVSMLMDPRGKVHATCGLLPVKNIPIPPDQYRPALERLEMAFLTAPLLTLPERIHISVPTEPGYGWSWVEKEGQGWKIITSVGAISLADVERAFPDQGSAVWGQLQTKGWITDILNGHARVVPKDQRTATLDKPFLPLSDKIEAMLERTELNSFDATASFSGTPVIREGWLKLAKTEV